MSQRFDPARFARNLAHARSTIAAHLPPPRGGAALPPPAIVLVTKSLAEPATTWLRAQRHGPLGENRVQDLLAKTDGQPDPAGWHFIGHLQRNKAARIIGRVSLLHSLDSRRLAEVLDRALARRAPGTRLACLVQVNVADEATKGGLAVAEAESQIPAWVAGYPHLELRGLMTLAPHQEAEQCRPVFRALRELRDRIVPRLGIAGAAFRELSMGMSDDYPIAVEEGATLVRLGRTLFE